MNASCCVFETVQQRRQYQRQERPLHRHTELEDREPGVDEQVEQPQPEYRNRLAQHHLRGRDRAHEQLVQRPDLPLAHHRQRREDETDRQDLDPHDRRDVEELALETRIEPRSRAQLHPVRHASPDHLHTELAGATVA
jgi:hypothetical protein